jgi:hypothetical protein
LIVPKYFLDTGNYEGEFTLDLAGETVEISLDFALTSEQSVDGDFSLQTLLDCIFW